MAVKSIRNKIPQAIPIQYNTDSGLATYILTQREIKYMDETRVSQYMTDLSEAELLEIATTSNSADTGFDAL